MSIRIVLENLKCNRESCEWYDDAILCKDCKQIDEGEEEIRKEIPKKRNYKHGSLFDNSFIHGFNECRAIVHKRLFGE